MQEIIELMPYPLTQVGGIESHVRELTRALQRQVGRRDAHIALAYRPFRGVWATSDASDSSDPRGPVDRGQPLPNTGHPPKVQRSESIAAIRRADILHLHGLARIPYFLLLRGLKTDATVVLTTHGSFWSEAEHVEGALSYARALFDEAFGDHLLRRCAAILVASEAEYQVMIASIAQRHREHIHILPLPVMVDDTQLQELGHPAANTRLLALGRQDRVKNFEFLAETVIANPDLPACDIVGPQGNSTRRLERIAASAPTGRIRVLPPVYDTVERGRLLRNAVAVVVPSRFESFSLVAHEAILVDTPVVMSDAAARAIDTSAVGVFRAGDSDSLAAELRRVCYRGRDRTARAGRAELRASMHSYDSYAMEMLAIYDCIRQRSGSQ